MDTLKDMKNRHTHERSSYLQGKTVPYRNENGMKYFNCRSHRLPPLGDGKIKIQGVDLVDIIARGRRSPILSLSSTDVTKERSNK